jgi:hypothetical protein
MQNLPPWAHLVLAMGVLGAIVALAIVYPSLAVEAMTMLLSLFAQSLRLARPRRKRG